MFVVLLALSGGFLLLAVFFAYQASQEYVPTYVVYRYLPTVPTYQCSDPGGFGFELPGWIGSVFGIRFLGVKLSYKNPLFPQNFFMILTYF